MPDDIVRPRLVLVTTPLPDGEPGETALRRALEGGDVASVIIDPAGREGGTFQDFAAGLLPVVQSFGAAALVADDTRCAGRVKADGVHVSAGDREALGEAVARFAPKLIVGGSGFNTRHDALEAGELLPDYLMFGRLGGDAEPCAHPRNLELAEWWAAVVAIPCIVLGGASVAELPEALATGAEFVALSRAVFADLEQAGEAVRAANALIDEAWQNRAAA